MSGTASAEAEKSVKSKVERGAQGHLFVLFTNHGVKSNFISFLGVSKNLLSLSLTCLMLMVLHEQGDKKKLRMSFV